MFEFTITKINKLGTADPKYGQRFWGEVAEDLKPISFNVMEGEFAPGDKITCEESLNKRSAKGTDFLQLKKVKLIGGQASMPVPGPYSVPVVQNDSGIHAQLDRIESKLDQLLGLDEKLASEGEFTDADMPSFDLN